MQKVSLNNRQQEAIFHNNGPMLVLAGPGSGKTTVIVNRIYHLIMHHKVNSREILVITFTKFASKEMKDRFNNLFGTSQHKIFFGTFHSYFFKIIRKVFNYSLEDILNETEKINILKKVISSLKINFDNEEELIQNIINDISILKNELIKPELYNPISCKSNEFLQIFKKYEDTKSSINKIDFDDMLIRCYNLLRENEDIRNAWKNRYRYILIDEFQDINKVQYECIKLLTCEQNNLFVVGDDDQSIYKFRGSRPDFLFQFLKDFKNVKQVILNINYRSTDQIIALCNNIIKENKNRFQKDIKGTQKKGKVPTLIRPYDQLEEAKIIVKKIIKYKKEIPLNDIAIIYRTNIQAREITESLINSNISFYAKDGIFSVYDHWITKDILAYLSLAISNNSNTNLARIINKPKRYISKDFLNDCIKNCDKNETLLNFIQTSSEIKHYHIDKLNFLELSLKQIKNKSPYKAIKYIMKDIGYEDYLQDYADFKGIKVKPLLDTVYELIETAKKHSNIPEYLETIQDLSKKMKNQNNDKEGVVLSTIHSVKGLEFDTVFLISCNEGFIPHEKSKSMNEIEEERRLLYVGITRAKKNLHISVIKSKYEQNVKQSRFLDNITKKGGSKWKKLEEKKIKS